MLQNAREIRRLGIPFIFDPGAGPLPLFNGEELRTFIEQADYVVVNDYESSLLQERTGWGERESRKGHGLHRHPRPQGRGHLPRRDQHERAAGTGRSGGRPDRLRRRLRAGLIYGIERQLDWPTIGRIANLMGAEDQPPGTQNQRFTFERFNAEFQRQYGYAVA